MRKLELLSPAKNVEVAIAAINNGADAVYIGGPAFGARQAVGNTVEEIARVAEYAHRFYCRVFVTLNTILYDDELAEVERLIHALYRVGADAIIVQDPAILKLDIPPIALHASTQMHNYDLERVKFLDRLGFQRIVLARELSLEQLRAIRREVKAELEYFVHGALCVSLSGQCYISHYLTGRSANRGECAQACRMRWTVADSDGQVLVKDKHVLSLKDLNLSAYLRDLVDIGIDSFKIEGRLKEADYVANVTRYYSARLDGIIAGSEGLSRVGNGHVNAGFDADPERSFNRGYTDYFIAGRKQGIVNMDTPKSTGKKVAVVKQAKGNLLVVEALETIHNADGLCYFDGQELRGIKVNTAEGNRLTCNERVTVMPGTVLYRNYDHEFVSRLSKAVSVRKIQVRIDVYTEEDHLVLVAEDEAGVAVTLRSDEVFERATNAAQAERIVGQLGKSGNTRYDCCPVEYHGDTVLFIPSAVVNGYRGRLLDLLTEEREKQRERWVQAPLNRDAVYAGEADWRLNVVNRLSGTFYREHGTAEPEAGFEVARNRSGRAVMTTRYCLLFELGMCRKSGKDKALKYPLYLSNNLGRFRLEFDCERCFMKVVSP
ncbi:U32 family peptidase [Butyricimonas sp. Marseille-P3923]|uniref:peptidase U32 family protein n=1 Tax=Butyricimonas sp. Marseille-P3923 TaxID=1987504 RepID=UPI000C087D2B|nr:U32 family peptidase [Butyricimonas sp. Marseille-P3923]